MMRSLWSGVSGLRMHQIGMDVEGNNIANVNTSGFKYSRVNYASMFSQTMAIATQPTTTGLGGQNPMQIGLGVNANSTMRVHSQGNVSRTDRNYDIAISGNGFFLVSPDGGNTQYLTRDGAFNLDAAGNFVNNSGYVVQGWLRDAVTGIIDTALPAGNLSWDPAMSLPANPSSEISLTATLNSGRRISQETSRFIYTLDSVHGYRVDTGQPNDENDQGNTEFYTNSNNALDVTEKGIDFAAVYNTSSYESLNLRENQGFWVSFKDTEFVTNTGGQAVYDPNNIAAQGVAGAGNGVVFWGDANQTVRLDITLNGVAIQNDNIRSLDAAITYINEFTTANGTRAGTGVRAQRKIDGSGIEFVNTNANGEVDNMKNINLLVQPANTAGESWQISAVPQQGNRTYTQSRVAEPDTWLIADPPAGQGNAGANQIQVITAHKYTYTSSTVDIRPIINPDGGPLFNGNFDAGSNTFTDPASQYYVEVLNGDLLTTTGTLARRFHSTEDLRELIQRDARYGVDYNGDGRFRIGDDLNEKATLTVDSTGRYVWTNVNEQSNLNAVRDAIINANPGGGAGQIFTDIYNPGNQATNLDGIQARDMAYQITTYKDDAGLVNSNNALAQLFRAWQGTLAAGTQTKSSSRIALSSFSTSLQMYDSLGTKHLLRVQWTKHNTTVDGGNEWQMILRLDEPATFNVTGSGRNNIVVGSVRFGNDGSLISYDPTTFTFSGNNGSAPNQVVSLNLGAGGAFNGLVSNDQTSALAKQDTDGYPPGVLRQGMENTRVDQEGNIIGSFTNGINLFLGKIAMGNVTNDSGLEDVGSNLYRLSSNSGSLTIGTAGTGGRGAFQTSALEASNADLSLSLTNLIVIQRGYQANSKTITTSDQMLNTLLQLKQ